MKPFETLITLFRGKSVSLVGGAQSIFQKENGPLIDSADVVIRINRGFPKHKKNQGKRTDLLAISCDISRFQHWRYFKSAPILWMTPHRHSVPVWMTRHLDLFFYPEEDWQKLFAALQNHRPSTGAMALDFIATHLQPKRLALFGFDFKKTNTLYEKKQKLGSHNWELEQARATHLVESAQAEGLDWTIN
jgi:hypothetical protein